MRFIGKYATSRSQWLASSACTVEPCLTLAATKAIAFGLTFRDVDAQLAEKLTARGVRENECNLANKIIRGSFTAAFS